MATGEHARALIETKALMKLYCQTVYQWANASDVPVSAELKEVLLGAAVRLFEIIEALPTAAVQKEAISG